MAGYDVRVAEASEQDAVLGALMLAFSTDPCMRYVLTKASAFVSVFRPFAMGMGGAAFDHGSAWIADGGAAAALWLPPGVGQDGEAIDAALAEVAVAEKQPVLAQVVEAMGHYHPHEPHWYLPLLGVDPSRQGQGLGSAILKASLQRCDADGVIAYLESSNPKNVPLYERFGFEVMGVIQPGDFPPMHPMVRQPRR
jgi:GNAT superfamily N-acetyltransferase